MNIEDGQIYFINFKDSIGREINSIHLGIIYKLPSLSDVVFCVPLTSPKSKHFKTETDFNLRNYKAVKHLSWQYLKQTDSMALLDQMRIISTKRLIKNFKDQDGNVVKLDNHTQNILREKILKYIRIVLYKDS